MQILTTGGMEDFSKHLDIKRTFSLICCMFWIFSPAEGSTISRVVGSRVVLRCENVSNITQLSWKMDKVILFTFNPQRPLHISEEARSLNVKMSESESEMYPLIIDRVQTSHTGNYTCEISMATGFREQTWELIITEHIDEEKWDKLVIAVATAVVCVCCLIFIIALVFLRRVGRQPAENSSYPPAAQMQDQTEDIYENCLETGANRPCKPRAY